MKADKKTQELVLLVLSKAPSELTDEELRLVLENRMKIMEAALKLKSEFPTIFRVEAALRQKKRELRAKPISELKFLLDARRKEHERLTQSSEDFVRRALEDSVLSSARNGTSEANARDAMGRATRAADLSDEIELLEKVLFEKGERSGDPINLSTC